MGLPPKKRGRPRKKRPEDTQEFWEKQLHNYRLGEHRGESKREVLACFFVDRKTGLTVSLDEISISESVTQRTDELASLQKESAANESVTLSLEWARYLEYMDVIAEALSPADKGAALKKLALMDARSRYWQQPPDIFRPMNAAFGTPAEFRKRSFYGELEISTRAVNRRSHVIEIWRLPPQELEDLDEGEEPVGHWEGLKWFSDAPKKGDS
jgi:hypothetical protein